MDYFEAAYFIYDDTAKKFIEKVSKNQYGTQIYAYHINQFIADDFMPLPDVQHAVACVSGLHLNKLLQTLYANHFSIGVVPLPGSKEQINNLYATTDFDKNLHDALQSDTKAVDLVEVNGTLMYSQAIIGRIPFFDTAQRVRKSFFKRLLYGIRSFFSIRLQKFEILTENEKKIVTAGSGIVILNHIHNNRLSKVFDFDTSMRDGQLTAVVVSPFSLITYIRMLISAFSIHTASKDLAPAIGYVKSKAMTISAGMSRRLVFENGIALDLPVTLKVIPEALNVSASEEFWENNPKINSEKESIKIENLPNEKEVNKYISKGVPFFSFASEERFKELFQTLRVDAKLNTHYLFFIIFSTLLAALGLYANSAAVVIGAMLVAPLMNPIISLSMGFLRAESSMVKSSLYTIFVGVALAIGASALLGYFLPQIDITNEMKARINPTILDLVIAILSGAIAAYAKSYKNVAQNLAGVAIAVALVPPLATAGIGLGKGDLFVFWEASLLFATNLVGITLAGTLTFLVLGFSNVIRGKKSIALIFAILLGVSFPLYISFANIVEKNSISQMLREHRFIVNGKYVIVTKVDVRLHKNQDILTLHLNVREFLNSRDLQNLKQDIQRLFKKKLFIRAKVDYIL